MFGIGACHKRGGFFPGFAHHPMAQFMQQKGACGGPAACLKDLNLTDEQLEKIAQLKMEGLAQFGQIKATFGKFIQQLANELTQEKIDRTKVQGLGQQVRAEKEKISEAFLERIVTFAEVLTPEQRRKLRAGMIRKFLGLDSAAEQED